MKKILFLLLVVLFLTAACSNKTAATSSTSGTSGTTDVAEADATSDTGATADEDENTDEDDSAETDDSDADASEESSDTPKLGANGFPDPAYYWEGDDFFDMQAFVDDCGIEKSGFGWSREDNAKSFFNTKFNDWQFYLAHHMIWFTKLSDRTIMMFASQMYGSERPIYIDSDKEFIVCEEYVNIYTDVVLHMLEHPEECPLAGSGIRHWHSGGPQSYVIHDD